jgi:hypothetical protein
MSSAKQVETQRAEYDRAGGSHETVSILHELAKDATKHGGGPFCYSERQARPHFVSRQAGLHKQYTPVGEANKEEEDRDFKSGVFVFFSLHLAVLVIS